MINVYDIIEKSKIDSSEQSTVIIDIDLTKDDGDKTIEVGKSINYCMWFDDIFLDAAKFNEWNTTLDGKYGIFIDSQFMKLGINQDA